MMKRFLITLVMLFWCSVGVADELFGIKLGDNVKNYDVKKITESNTDDLKWKLFEVKPKKQNPDFDDYHIQTTLRDKIHTISANLKRDFKSEEACIQRITYYVDIIHNRLKKIDLGMDSSPTHKIYLNKQNYSIMERQLLAVCFESNGRYIASLSYEDFTIQKDLSKEGL